VDNIAAGKERAGDKGREPGERVGRGKEKRRREGYFSEGSRHVESTRWVKKKKERDKGGDEGRNFLEDNRRGEKSRPRRV